MKLPLRKWRASFASNHHLTVFKCAWEQKGDGIRDTMPLQSYFIAPSRILFPPFPMERKLALTSWAQHLCSLVTSSRLSRGRGGIYTLDLGKLEKPPLCKEKCFKVSFCSADYKSAFIIGYSLELKNYVYLGINVHKTQKLLNDIQ